MPYNSKEPRLADGLSAGGQRHSPCVRKLQPPASPPALPASRPRPATPPAEGERRAQRGYVAQYRAAAAAICASLDRGDLRWVEVASPFAGIDLVLGFERRDVGHQFKSAPIPGRFRLRTLLLGVDGLLAPLTAGSKGFREANPGLALHIRLVTNDVPAGNDLIPRTVMERTRCMQRWSRTKAGRRHRGAASRTASLPRKAAEFDGWWNTAQFDESTNKSLLAMPPIRHKWHSLTMITSVSRS